MRRICLSAACAAAVAFNGVGSVPAEYQAIEWIESTGAQGIDLGFSPAKEGGTALDIEFELTSDANNQAILSGGWYDFGSYILIVQNGIIKFNANKEFATYDSGLRYRLTTDCAGAYTVFVNGETFSSGTVSLSNTKSPDTHWVFCDGNTKNRKAFVRLFRLCFSDSEGILHDFVPCYRKSDTKPGLYDLKDDTFHSNELTGADLVCGPDLFFEDEVVVSGEPLACGNPTPAYGKHGGYEAGTDYEFSVERVFENSDKTMQSICTGYEVLTNGVVYDSGSFGASSGEICSFSMKFPQCQTGAKVIWKWVPSCKVTVVAEGGGGTVSKTSEWLLSGETFEVVATPAVGYVFYRWEDTSGKVYGYEPSLSFPVTDTVALKAMFGEELSVLPSGGDDASELQQAIANAPVGSVIRLAADSVYKIGSTIEVGKDISILGADSETTILDGENSCRIFHVDGMVAPRTLIAGVKLYRGYDGSGWGGNGGEGMEKFGQFGGGAVCLAGGGTVSNCVIEACGGRHNGGAFGVHVVGGRLTKSVIRNFNNSNTIMWGQAARVFGGGEMSWCVVSNCVGLSLGQAVFSAPVVIGDEGTLLRNCLIVDCRHRHSGTASVNHGSAVMVRTSGSVIQNCTISGNSICSSLGSALVLNANATATISNTIIADNACNTDNARMVANVTGSGSFDHCAINPMMTGAGNIEAPIVLFTPGGYELMAGSPMLGTGSCADWMMDAVDLKGVPRMRDGAVDMGAFTYVRPALACAIMSDDARSFKGTLSATINSVIDGDADGVCYYWDKDGDGIADESGVDKQTLTLDETAFGEYPVTLYVTNAASVGAKSGTITFTLVPLRLYVNVASAEPQAPYGSEEKAARTIAEALESAVDGCEISVAPGTYVLADTLAVNKAVEIRSTGSRDDTTLFVDGAFRGVALNVSGAVFCGMTVTNGYLTKTVYDNGGKLGGGNLFAGEGTTVEHCRFSGARCYTTDEVGGVSLGVYNAIVRDCEIVNNVPNPNEANWQLFYGVIKVSGLGSVVERCLIADNAQVSAHRATAFRRATALQLEGGVVRNCLLRNNYMTEGHNGNGTDYDRGVAVFAKDGVLENCTVIGNVSADVDGSRCPAVWAEAKAVVRNCIVWGNKATDGGSPDAEALSDANWGGLGNAFAYCCTVPALPDEHSLSEDPRFRSPEACDGALRAVSPCARTGLFTASWMTDALDFYGKPMAYGTNKNRVGMGCSAVPITSGMTILIQ